MYDYAILKSYVSKKGGLRLAAHGPLRDKLVELCVEEFPIDCQDTDQALEVLRARVKRRVREKYGSVVAMILIGVLVNLITKIVWEWWLSRDSHRVLMAGWNRHAKETQAG